MASTAELEAEILADLEENPDAYTAPVNDVITIDPETKTINLPSSEVLFGTEEEHGVERKYFKCPRIVGDNIDLFTHQIYISYMAVKDKNATFIPNSIPQSYWCDDVALDETGNYITFSWLLSGNVLASRGFVGFAVIAKSVEGEILKTRWKTAPAVGTVLMTLPDAGEGIAELYPDIITQLLDRMDAVEEIATEEAMQGYVNDYLGRNPVQLDPTLTDSTKAAPADLVGEIKGDLDNISTISSEKIGITKAKGRVGNNGYDANDIQCIRFDCGYIENNTKVTIHSDSFYILSLFKYDNEQYAPWEPHEYERIPLRDATPPKEVTEYTITESGYYKIIIQKKDWTEVSDELFNSAYLDFMFTNKMFLKLLKSVESDMKIADSKIKSDLNDYCVDSDFTLLKQNYLTSAYNGFYVNKNGDFGFNNVDSVSTNLFVTAFLPPLKELCFTITSGENWVILGGHNDNFICKDITGNNQILAEFVNSSDYTNFNTLKWITDYPKLEIGTTIKIIVDNGIYKFFKLENGIYNEYYSLNKKDYSSSVWDNERLGFIASGGESSQFDGNPIFKNVNAKFPKTYILIEQNKPYYSKKYHALGDSITAGVNATNVQYFTYFDELCGFKVITKDGIGGSCLSSGESNSGVSRLNNIPDDSDIVSIFMGTNDFGHHHMLGNMQDSTPTDTSTFYGALKYTCEYMNANFNNKWFFITPLQRNYNYFPADNMGIGVETNRNGNTLEDFVNAIIKVCNHYSVPYIDLYHNCFDGHSEKVHELYLADGLHPNPNGHIIMARKIAKFINNIF